VFFFLTEYFGSGCLGYVRGWLELVASLKTNAIFTANDLKVIHSSSSLRASPRAKTLCLILCIHSSRGILMN